MPDVTHPADTKIIMGGFVERRRDVPQDNGTYKTAAIAAAIAALGAVIFLVVWPMISGSVGSAPQQAAVVTAPPPVVKPVEIPKATVLRSMNVRSGPSTSDTVIVTLKPGTLVATSERRGNWVRVTLDAVDGKPAQQGWVFGTSLKFPTTAAQPATSPEAEAAAPPVAAAPDVAPEPATTPAPEAEHAKAPAAQSQAAPEPTPESRAAVTAADSTPDTTPPADPAPTSSVPAQPAAAASPAE